MLSAVDLSLIGLYLLFAFAVGLWASRKAGTGLSSYFIAGRSLPGWWLGTSMVATQFASDTPLVITGFVAKYGIAGNWFWWSMAICYVLLAVFFARKWQRSGVITDAELTELRYEGKPAAGLRLFKAVSSALVFNCIVLGWVFAAMAKISRPFLKWESVLGSATHASLASAWPDFLLFKTLDNTLTIFVLLFFVVIYSSAGGIRGVILTDLVQFALAMTCAVLFGAMAVQYVGGLDGLWTQLHSTYPENGAGPSADELTSFWPSWQENGLMGFGVCMASIGFVWWANNAVDGSGYLSQRINTAKSGRDAERGTLWFAFATFALRTWPWVAVGLVALVVFPLSDPTAHSPLGAQMRGDREMAYPLLMQLILPSGLLGLTLASLIAAFMSTVDTHINWGASYLSNDVYFRFVRPKATDRELVWVSRASVLLVGLIGVFVAAQIDNVGDMWKFNLAMLSGLGAPHVLRWVWWRANAWTEISGMGAGLVLAIPAYTLGYADDYPAEYVIGVIALVSTGISLLVTFLTPQVSEAQLSVFCEKVRPLGFWGERSSSPVSELRLRLLAWASGVTMIYCTLFGGGLLLRMNYLGGSFLLLAGAGLGYLTLKLLDRAEIESGEDVDGNEAQGSEGLS